MPCCTLLSREPPFELGPKFASLRWLARNGLPTPPAICIATSPQSRSKVDDSKTADARARLTELVSHSRTSFRLPLFSVRCESKNWARTQRLARRDDLPHSVLNVGVLSLLRSASIRRSGFEQSLHSIYQERAAAFGDEGAVTTSESTIDELLSWVARFEKRIGRMPEPLSNMVVQQMVFGNLDERSASGIITTTPPHPRAPTPYGVALVRHQGFGIVPGRWGPNETTLEALEALNPRGYRRLLGIAAKIREALGYRLLEFTLQGEEVFILEVSSRRPTKPVPGEEGYDGRGTHHPG